MLKITRQSICHLIHKKPSTSSQELVGANDMSIYKYKNERS